MESIQIASDLHLEFQDPHVSFDKFIKPSAKYLAILGDLGYPNEIQYRRFIEEMSKRFVKVFIVSGNHEYFSKNGTPMEDYDKKIDEICSVHGNVYYLNNKEHVLNDKYVILGTTLWTEIPKDKEELVSRMLNDYKYVYLNKNKLIEPKHVSNKFKENVNWLKKMIEKYKSKKIIVMSHHLPSEKLIDKRYERHPANCGFASNLDYLMKNNVLYWFCGHTHTGIKETINSCECHINPHGYNDENKDYSNSYVIELSGC